MLRILCRQEVGRDNGFEQKLFAGFENGTGKTGLGTGMERFVGGQIQQARHDCRLQKTALLPPGFLFAVAFLELLSLFCHQDKFAKCRMSGKARQNKAA